MKTRRYDLTSAVAALILFFGVVAVNPVLAQDFGDAGFNGTAEVVSAGAANANRLGATGDVDDGVTQLGAFMQGGTAYFTVNASVIGNLHVWIDEDNDSDFTDQTRQDFATVAGNNHIAVSLGAATPGLRWFRFMFEGGTNVITDANTDYNPGADGEIEDWQFTVIGSGNPVTFATTTGGVTTTIERNGLDVQVSDGSNTIFLAPVANISSLTINGDNAADDAFVVDLTAGDPIPSGGLTVNGQGQASSDDLTITDGTTSALSSVGTFFTNGSFSTGVETEDHAGDDNNSGDRPTDDNVVDNNDTTGDDVSRDQDATDDGTNQSVDDPADEVLPDNWALGQNYPNPFNPTTTIEFSMPQAAGVTVRVYNVLGQVVKTLVNGTLPPGIHRVQWDATDESGAGVSSGLYIYRMETEAFQATKTLVLMK